MTAPSNTTSLLSEFSSPSLSPSLLQSLLHRLLSHPSIHNGFIDILNLPPVQAALANNPQRTVIVQTLELFGYGTVEEYYELKKNDAVMKLNDVQLEKLMMLSVVSIVKQRMVGSNAIDGDDNMQKKSRRTKTNGILSIPYSELSSKLHLPPTDIRKLEDLLIQCIYANLLSGKLDQCSKCLIVEPHVSILGRDEKTNSSKSTNKEIHGSILSRDIPPSSQLSQMISNLQTFTSHTTSLLATLQQCSNTNTALRKSDAARWKEVSKLLNEGSVNAKFGVLEREMEGSMGGERGGREVKRSKMQAVMMQRFS